MRESIFKGPAMISHLVKTISEKYPEKQVGKTFIQKMVYLLAREGTADFDYSMYHYGPYSGQVSEELDFTENIGAVEIDWAPSKGYFIKSKDTSWEQYLNEGEKRVIDELVDKYGEFSAIELSIITTSLFIRDNFDVRDKNELIHVVASLKPQPTEAWIKDILKKARVIQ